MPTDSKSIDATQIEGWLTDLQSKPQRAIDPNANWRYEIEFPPNSAHRMVVMNPKNSCAVVVASGMNLAPQHIAGWEGLDQDDQKDFVFDLQETLIRDHVEFQIQGVTNQANLTCPTGVQFMSPIYKDGLSLDVLAQRMGCILRAETAASVCINRYLGPSVVTGGAGQFDFRRLGRIQ